MTRYTIPLIFIAACLIVPLQAHALDKLLSQSDLTYLGAFSVPYTGLGTAEGLNYGGSAIAYNPDNNSLYITGAETGATYDYVAEISIPPLTTGSVGVLNRATVLQQLADATEGNRSKLTSSGTSTSYAIIGGLLKYGNSLLGSSVTTYDGGTITRTAWTSGLTLATTGDFAGNYQVGASPSPVPNARHLGRYLASIPNAWQTALGGKVFTGSNNLSVLSTTSSGPAAFSFDPDRLGIDTPVTAYSLLDYPIAHQTIGTWDTTRTLFNKGVYTAGAVFPSGSKSVLFIGMFGWGENRYGRGTTNLAEHGNRKTYPAPYNVCQGATMVDDSSSDTCSYDRLNNAKGPHTWPYSNFVWAYDANDLARVKTGGRVVDDPSPNLVDSVSASSTDTYKPWFIKPYASWFLPLPYASANNYQWSGSAAYDENNSILYISQTGAETTSGRVAPVIHGFSVSLASETPTCYDGLQNGSETGVDTGGLCPIAKTAPSNPSNITNTSGTVTWDASINMYGDTTGLVYLIRKYVPGNVINATEASCTLMQATHTTSYSNGQCIVSGAYRPFAVTNLTTWIDTRYSTGDTYSVQAFDSNLLSSAEIPITTDTLSPIAVASKSSGKYIGPQSVGISANETATIYYTLDGTTPTESSTEYSAAIPVLQNEALTTLKYFAKDAAGNSSAVQTQVYKCQRCK